MTEQKIQEFKDQGFKLIKIELTDKTFYLRKPTKTELVLYQDESLKNKGSLSSRAEKFVRKLFVGDNIEEFNSHLEERPLSIGIFLEECLKGLGGDENFTATEL